MVMSDAQPDYNFITNPAQQQKKPLLPGGNSMQARIFVVLGGVILLIIIGVIVSTLISSGGKEAQATLLKTAQQQAELIRISTIGVKNARDPNTLNLASTTNLTLQSDQKVLLTHVKADNKQLALGKDTKTDIALTNAEQANKFDEVFAQTLQAQLVAYQKTLKSAYDATSNKKLKAALGEQFKNASTLASKQ